MKTLIKYTIFIRITLFQIADKDEDVWGGVDAVLYMLASDHVQGAKEDELRKFVKLLFIIWGLGVY